MNELDIVYRSYYRSTNMSYSELLRWANNPCSNQASLDRGPIKRNLILLSTPKSQWTDREIEWAKKTISFIARMRKNKAGALVPGCGISKNHKHRKRCC